MSSASRSVTTSSRVSASSISTRWGLGAQTLKRTPAGVGVAPISIVQALIFETRGRVEVGERSGSCAVSGVFDGHLVTEATHGDDGRRRHWTRAQLYAQPANVHVDGSATTGVLVAPHERGQIVARQNLVRATGERRNQAILGRRQLDWLAAQGHPPPRAIDNQLTNADV